MNTLTYVPYTAQEAAVALAISDCADMTGCDIARDLLAGATELTDDELERLAAHKGVNVDYLIEHDPAFEMYADPVIEAKMGIASNLIDKGHNAEFAADVCGLMVDDVKRLIRKKGLPGWHNRDIIRVE